MSALDGWVRRWWAGEAGTLGRLADAALAPAEAGFRAAVRLRAAGFERGWIGIDRVGVPVVSVGNLAVGGAGKTPFAGWLVRRLASWGRRPAVVLRGYGADEIALHRTWSPDVPVFAAKRRIDGARQAVEAGCDVVVLDDGFQHRRLARELDVVLVAAEGWTANPRLLPRGPWREPPSALGRAGIVVVTRKSASADEAADVERSIRERNPSLPTGVAAILPSHVVELEGVGEMPMDALGGRRVLAVAALATPEPFLRHLRDAGAAVEPALYPDHHDYTAADVKRIESMSRGRILVTTAKDAVKLRGRLAPAVEAWVVEQAVAVERGAEALDAALAQALGEHG